MTVALMGRPRLTGQNAANSSASSTSGAATAALRPRTVHVRPGSCPCHRTASGVRTSIFVFGPRSSSFTS